MWWPVRGSSPQVRGRRDALLDGVAGLRLIPAGAGQTRCSTGRRRRVRAHPRRCGADSKVLLGKPGDWGSSPQVRGRRIGRATPTGQPGLIPAGAGQTLPDFVKLSTRVGSSPQVRGRLRKRHQTTPATGLIPAGAGQTLLQGCGGAVQWAHPRRCGADRSASVYIGGQKGSSPQVRGRPIFPRPCRAGYGLIPAGAGQTDATRSATLTRWAHPRRCGADSCPPPAG